MARTPQLTPDSQFPEQAIQRSKQDFPKADNTGGDTWTWNIASAPDQVAPWGRAVALRDRQLRDFWPTEPYLAGAVSNVSFRHATLEWEIRGSDRVAQAVTDILISAIAGDSFGWVPFMEKFTQDMATQDNGGVF